MEFFKSDIFIFNFFCEKKAILDLFVMRFLKYKPYNRYYMLSDMIMNIDLDNEINMDEIKLPDGFRFKTLSPAYTKEIQYFLNRHYIENTNCDLKVFFVTDYLYWYLKYIPAGLCIGLVYENKLVGLITAYVTDMIICQNRYSIAIPNFLCVHQKLQNLGLSKLLGKKLRSVLDTMRVQQALYQVVRFELNEQTQPKINPFCRLQNVSVPLNYEKLISIGFIPANCELYVQPEKMPTFRLLCKDDVPKIVPKLNNFLSKYKIRPFFTEESATHFFLPKKRIVYSFVKTDDQSNITDFISVTESYMHLKPIRKNICSCNVTYYFHETVSLTRMIESIIPKLLSYGVDILNLLTVGKNEYLNINKFPTDTSYDICIDGLALSEIMSTEIFLAVV
jgi:glycylpeptide N-tetradecanoyltransferase